MLFNDFIKYIPKIEKETLLSTDAHAKMAPLERISYLNEENYMDKNQRKAAVLMLFYPKNSVTHLALIVRNSYPGVHSSQIGFPGGKVEEYDADDQEIPRAPDVGLGERDHRIEAPGDRYRTLLHVRKVLFEASRSKSQLCRAGGRFEFG